MLKDALFLRLDIAFHLDQLSKYARLQTRAHQILKVSISGELMPQSIGALQYVL